MWDVASGKNVAVLKGLESVPQEESSFTQYHQLGEVEDLDLSPDGERLVAVSRDYHVPRRAGEETEVPFTPVRVWNARTGTLLFTLPQFICGARSVRFSPDGKQLLVVSDNSERILTLDENGKVRGSQEHNGGMQDLNLRIFDAQTGNLIRILLGDKDPCDGAAWGPDSKRVVTTGWDNNVRILDAGTGEELCRLEPETRAGTNEVVFSPDGRYIVGLRVMYTVLPEVLPLWDARTGKLRAYLASHSDAVIAAVFSPGGDALVTTCKDGTARLWDPATGKDRFVLRGHEGAVHGATFSPDGKRVATVSEDGTARIWDVATGQAWLTLAGHGGPVYSAVFSPDGEQLATTSGDGTIRIWPVDPLPLARARRPRDLTPAERLRFGPNVAAEPAGGIWSQELADHFVRIMQNSPGDLPACSRAALVCLAAGDHAGYRRICGTVLERYLQNNDANVVNYAVWICAVGPEAVADYQPLVPEMTRALGPKPDTNRLNTLGALLYRAGHFEEAVRRLEEAITTRDKVGTIHDWLFLAMAHQRLGHRDEARRWFEKATQVAENAESGSWEQRLEIQLLHREAEQVVSK